MFSVSSFPLSSDTLSVAGKYFLGLGLVGQLVALLVLWRIVKSVLRPFYNRSPLYALKSPKGGSFVLGHMMAFSVPSLDPETWLHRVTEKLGPVAAFRDIFNVRASFWVQRRLTYLWVF